MEKLGIQASERSVPRRYLQDKDRPYAWDGKKLIVKGRSDSDVIHDIAHWICAAKYRRRLPEFGLGESPDCWSRYIDKTVSSRYADQEEGAASLLGIAIEHEFGMGFGTLDDHCWINRFQYKENKYRILGGWASFDSFWKYIVLLMKKGHLDEKGHPTCLD